MSSECAETKSFEDLPTLRKKDSSPNRSNRHSLQIDNIEVEPIHNLDEILIPKADTALDEDKSCEELKCNFEAEKFSINIIYGAKIEALEKQLQQVLNENHHLRKQMTKMKYIVGSLTQIINRSCKLYLGERDGPPKFGDLIDSDTECDYTDPNTFPIEELQAKIQNLLCDYREQISVFTEKSIRNMYHTKSTKDPDFQGLESSLNVENKSENYSEGLSSRYKHNNMK